MAEIHGGQALVAFLNASDWIGLTQLQRDALLYQGILDNLHQLQFCHWMVSEVCKRIDKAPLPPDEPVEPNQNVNITYIAQNNLEALAIGLETICIVV